MISISNFSFNELTKTDTGLDNILNDMNVLSNLCRLAAFLQTIRNELQNLHKYLTIGSNK